MNRAPMFGLTRFNPEALVADIESYYILVFVIQLFLASYVAHLNLISSSFLELPPVAAGICLLLFLCLCCWCASVDSRCALTSLSPIMTSPP